MALTSPTWNWARQYWVELLWIAFVVGNTVGILFFREWATVPFHFVWIGLSLLYGWRVWEIRATSAALASVVLLTGVALLDDVIAGDQALDELTEIPLMAAVFVVMVWYVRRNVAAREQVHRVSEHNLALLHRQRQFVHDVSHELRTPLTIALGHAELVRRTTHEPVVAGDLDVIIDELNRLKHISDRLLALAASEQPDFLHRSPTRVDALVAWTWSSWSPTHPAILLGTLAPVSTSLDPAQVRNALDELISNAVRHTPPGTPITLSVSRVDSAVVLSVADRGPGIPYEAQERIFDRFARLGGRDPQGGIGLGLALVKAIAEAHGGRLSLTSAPGSGATFALWLPLAGAEPDHPIAGAAEPALGPVRDIDTEVTSAARTVLTRPLAGESRPVG